MGDAPAPGFLEPRKPIDHKLTEVVAEPAYEIPTKERSMGLRDYVRVLQHHLWLAIGIPLVITGFVTYLMLKTPNYFEPTSTVEINLEVMNPALGDSRNYAMVVNDDPAYFNTQLQLITSPALLRRVITTLDLEHDPVYLRHMSRGGRMLRRLMRFIYLGKSDAELGLSVPGEPLDPSLQPEITPQQLEEARRLEPFVADLQKRITLEPVKEARTSMMKDTRLVQITVRHPNAQMAAKLTNSVADALVFANAEQRRVKNDGAGQYLRTQIKDLQKDIGEREQELQDYSAKHGFLSLEPGQDTAVDRLMNLNRKLIDAENDRKLAEADYQQALAPNAALALADESAKQIADSEAKLSELREKRSQLLVTATEKWPEVQEVDHQIATLQDELKQARDRASQRVITNLKTKYEQKKAYEDSLRATLDQQRRATVVQNEAAVEYRLRDQRIQTEKSQLQALLQRLNENVVAQAATANNIRVIDYAINPVRPEPAGPYRLVWIGIAFLLSSSVAVGAAVFMEHLDVTFRSGTEVVSVLRIPSLAVIPSIGTPRSRFLTSASKLGLTSAPDTKLLLSDAGHDWQLAEAYRRLRTAVTMSLGSRSPRTLLVSSCMPSEGKTTTAVNLSMSIASTGIRVLLIDADLRRGRVHSVLEMPNENGLSDILLSKEPVSIKAAIQNHVPSGVHVLTCGSRHANSAELLTNARMAEVVAEASWLYDVVIVDSPALSACTDPLLLARRCEVVLLVIQGGKTSREVVRGYCTMLRGVGARILGAALNNVVPRSGDTPDYYYYYFD